VSAPAKKYTTPEIVARLQNRYPQNRGQWATIVEFEKIDFMAVATWMSLEFAVHGHEIKASRSDWLRELKKPYKARFSMARCDYWWLAAPRGVAKPEEIPMGWGFMELGPNGFRAVLRAPRLRPKLDRQRTLEDGSINEAFFNREAFAMMARRFNYASADRDALMSAVPDPQPHLDLAADRTGRFTSGDRAAQRKHKKELLEYQRQWMRRYGNGS
jgi:hypothetical protein